MRARAAVWTLASLLAGLGLATLANEREWARRPTLQGASPLRSLPEVAGNNWGQHVPRSPHPESPDRTETGTGVPVDAASEPEPAAEVREVSGEARAGNARASLSAGVFQPSPMTRLTPQIQRPVVARTSHVDARSVVLGEVTLGERVFVAPFVSVRADVGAPIWIGSDTNLQDGVVIHGLPVWHRAEGGNEPGSERGGAPSHAFVVDGRPYSVYVEGRVSIEHQAQVHGPAWIEADVWVGMQALVSGSRVGRGVIIEPSASVLGVRIPPHRYVPAGVVVDRQRIADQLPDITAAYRLRSRNQIALRSARTLVEAYTEGQHEAESPQASAPIPESARSDAASEQASPRGRVPSTPPQPRGGVPFAPTPED